MRAVSFLFLVFLFSCVEIVQGDEQQQQRTLRSSWRQQQQDYLDHHQDSLGQYLQPNDEADDTSTIAEPSPGPSAMEPSTSMQPTSTPSTSPSPTVTPLIERIREFFTFSTIYCEDNAELPFCPMPNGEPEERGMWVCRTLLDDNNRLTRQSTCINPLFSLMNQDECGCCGETCPDLTCPCLCTIGGAQGVLLGFTAPADQQYVPSCFTNEVAKGLLSSETEFWTCIDGGSCPEPLIGQLV